jgi:uncharacterized membrane protein required for colicin V production
VTERTSRAAIATLALGCVALASWVLAVVLAYVFPPAPGHHSPDTGDAAPDFMMLMLLSGLMQLFVLVTALVAFVSVRRSGGTRRGIGLALLGAALAATPYALGLHLPDPW